MVTVCGASAALTGLGEARSLLAGGAFMVLDFHLIRMLVSRLIRPGGSQAWTVLLLTLKFVLVVALIVGVFYQFPVAPMSFAFGASLLLVAAVLDAVWLGEEIEPSAEDAATTT
jgi:hypothetical protein